MRGCPQCTRLYAIEGQTICPLCNLPLVHVKKERDRDGISYSYPFPDRGQRLTRKKTHTREGRMGDQK